MIMCLVKKRAVSTAVLITFFLLVGASLFGLEVMDSLGRTVHFDKPPDRIVIAGRALLLVADAVYMFPDAVKKVHGIEKITQGKGSFISVIDPRSQEKQILPVRAGTEEILAATPHAVLMKSFMRSKLGKPLESLGVKVLYYELETPAQYFDDIRSIGTLLDNRERAEEIIAYYRTRIGRVESATASLPEAEKPTALLVYYSERGGTTSFNVPPSSWMQTILTEKAGGIPVWKDEVTGSGWMKVGVEQIAAWDPDYIFLTSYFSSSTEAVEKVKADPVWKNIQAVRNGNLFAFPSDYYSWDQPDPRWLLGLLWMGTKLHPQRLAEVDIISEVKEFYRKLYFLSSSEYWAAVEPALDGDLP